MHGIERQRGQIVQQCRQAVCGQPCGCGFGRALMARTLGRLRFLHGRGALGAGAFGIVVLEQHRRQAPAQVPLEVAGQGAQEHVGAHALGGVDVDRAHVESGGLEVAECTLHARQRLVGFHGLVGADGVPVEAGAHDVDAVQLRLGGDFRLVAREAQSVVLDDDVEVFFDLAAVGLPTDAAVYLLKAA